eukprot:COSAG02_NODE_46714_length_346_cov_2.433198_1_plen_45_part_01
MPRRQGMMASLLPGQYSYQIPLVNPPEITADVPVYSICGATHAVS